MKKILQTGIMALGICLIGFIATANATLIFNLGGGDFSADSEGTSTGIYGGSGAQLPNFAMGLLPEGMFLTLVLLIFIFSIVHQENQGLSITLSITIHLFTIFPEQICRRMISINSPLAAMGQ